MKVTIMSPRRVLHAGEADSVFIPGDTGEYELLNHHAPLVGLLGPGRVVIDWERTVAVDGGIVKFDRNECMILVDEAREEARGEV